MKQKEYDRLRTVLGTAGLKQPVGTGYAMSLIGYANGLWIDLRTNRQAVARIIRSA